MANSPKKVLVRRFSGDTLPGYLPQAAFVHNHTIDLLDLSGRLISLLINDIKTVCYVRDFNLSDAVNPERLTRRTFLARPRSEGLWLRLTFRSGDQLEGLAPTDHTLLDALADDAGLFLTPPDTRSNTQRIYIPRLAIQSLEVVGLIGASSRKRADAGAQIEQPELFPNTPETS